MKEASRFSVMKQIDKKTLSVREASHELGLSVQSIHINKGKYCKSQKDAALKALIGVLTRTKRPVILDITHRDIGGHWIVVDAVRSRGCCGSKLEFDVRDSHAGLAHRISYNELRESIDPEFTDLIYFEPTSQAGTSCVIL